MWLALNSPCLPGFVCFKNIHLKPASTVRIIDFKSPLWGWQWAWDMCRVVCSGQKIPTRCCYAHAAVELLIKALADGMFGYILKAACLPLYYACLCSCARCCQRCVWAMLVWLNAYTRFFLRHTQALSAQWACTLAGAWHLSLLRNVETENNNKIIMLSDEMEQIEHWSKHNLRVLQVSGICIYYTDMYILIMSRYICLMPHPTNCHSTNISRCRSILTTFVSVMCMWIESTIIIICGLTVFIP